MKRRGIWGNLESNPVINVAIFVFVRIHGMGASSGLETVTTHGTESSRETCPSGLGDEGRSLAGGGIGHTPLT